MTIESLPWLPPPPPDFRAQCRQLSAAADPARALQFLGGHALDETALGQLAAAIQQLRATSGAVRGLTPFTLGILSNATSKLLEPCITASGTRYGLDLRVVSAGFGQVVQEALAADTPLKRARPDAILLALDDRGIPGLADGLEDDGAVAQALGFVRSVLDGLQQGGRVPVLVQSVACPPEPLLGHLDLTVTGTRRRRIHEFNLRLAAGFLQPGEILFDVERLAHAVGTAAWFDLPLWHHAKVPFAPRFAPLYADAVARIVAVLRGAVRKVLVLDLDDTLWGGVVADDGVDGIVVGQGSAGGEAFLAVQSVALALRARGVLLAVCSKNDEANARLPFRDHPDMLLREEHFAAFVANWNDKATNLEAIAAALNLGLDSLVFLDNSPAERAQVRRELPQVAVPELPEDPSLYGRCLLLGGYFESLSLSDKDRSRAGHYQADAISAATAAGSRDLGEYLGSLGMVATIAPFDAVGRQRIVQLIARSNQFNLTTRRYGEADVQAWELRPEAITLQVRLRDRFGDNGMIGVAIGVVHEGDCTIDTWLMSCRVLGRRVPELMLRELAAQARARGARRLIGTFVPTGRNQLVKDHYRTLGFAPLSTAADGSESWVLDLAGYVAAELPIAVEYAGPRR